MAQFRWQIKAKGTREKKFRRNSSGERNSCPWGYSFEAPQRRWHFLRVLKNEEELCLQIKEWVSVGKDISGRRALLALKFVGTKFLLPSSLWKILFRDALRGVGDQST